MDKYMKALKQLFTAQQDYINFLTGELNRVAPFLLGHGYDVSKADESSSFCRKIDTAYNKAQDEADKLNKRRGKHE